MKKELVALVLAVLVLGGCTTAGPYVTHVSSDGKGNITVERGTVNMNAFMGTVSNGTDFSSQTIKVCDCPPDKK
jgi:type IV secretion system protein VirB7